MDGHRLPDDQPVLDQLPDLLMGVGIGDFIGLIGVQPDLLLTTVEDARGKPLLQPEHTHGCRRSSEKRDVASFLMPAFNRGFSKCQVCSHGCAVRHSGEEGRKGWEISTVLKLILERPSYGMNCISPTKSIC
uniref:Uncharacterized protein n=1 Tax=Peromyscus maniculatus bairdii TaxID=230844 RepID=A0A8C8UL44_PERMB